MTKSAQISAEELELEEGRSLSDYLDIIRRRKWMVSAIAALIFFGGIVAAVTLPPIYRSTGTILIEGQEIPQDLVGAAVSSYAAQRLGMISKEIMNRSNLLWIIEQFDLYPEIPDDQIEALLNRMQGDISLEMTSGDVSDPTSGRSTEGTVAFDISYEGKDPELVQKVANKLVMLFLDKNAEERSRKASEVVEFVRQEVEQQRAYLEEIERRIADFKERHVDKLPEFASMNMETIERLRSEMDDITRELRSLEERRFYLQGQLTQIEPYAPVQNEEGKEVLEDDDRLRVLQSEYTSALAVYGKDHPDVKRLKREMRTLEAKLGRVSALDEREILLAKLREELQTARRKYTAQHPDIRKLERKVALLERELAESPPVRQSSSRAARPPDNPAYITLQAQLSAVSSEINSLQVQRSELHKTIANYEAKLVDTPQVEREYTSLMREREDALKSYQEAVDSLKRAELTRQLEVGNKGERFTLLEPPQLPEVPVKPNRPAIVLLGLLLALAGGVGYALLADSLDHTINGRRDLSLLLGEAPLAVVPYIDIRQDGTAVGEQRTPWLMVSLFAGGVLLFAVGVHLLWMPLDVLWGTLFNK
ncbi:MAG TPA: lipopolysaccharide biosynthesis protein [Gammaproteobacteria bacterium]|nr:lipopolysaccharide biosynthesis protein [Gammaproteobacteria bacterium]